MSGGARRYLGLELSGAKNHKTALAAIEYYAKENKIFLLETYERVVPREEQTSDEALLELIREHIQSHTEGVAGLGVNVPLSLPPCIPCTKKTCPTPARCKVPEVKWMRDQTRKAQKVPHRNVRALEFTPYTQRPIELWMRYHVLPELDEALRFEIDETLGGNRAPLAARMHYLQWHLRGMNLSEAWPKLTVSILGKKMGIPRRTLNGYRHLETGGHARFEILEILSRELAIFIYERDQNKLAESLAAFDAFICALTALLADTERTAPRPRTFPQQGNWVAYPLT